MNRELAGSEAAGQGAGPAGPVVRPCVFGLAFIAWAILSAVAGPAAAQGAGDLMIIPTRVVFEGRTRSAEVALINRGTKPATYRLSFQNMRMTEDGQQEPVETPAPGERFAKDLIRYSPRQVELQPGAPQVIRLLVRAPADLEPGEYRSHLYIRALPPEDAGTDIETLNVAESEIGVQITMIYGISIPVIVRHGELSASVSLSDLAVRPAADGGRELSLRLDRSGNRSVYGEIEAVFTAKGGDPVTVGLVRGLAVYTPNAFRTARLALNPPKGVALRNGRLQVTYRSLSKDGGEVLAEAELALP